MERPCRLVDPVPAGLTPEQPARAAPMISPFASFSGAEAKAVGVVLAPSDEKYVGFGDVSGGVNDSHTCAIACQDENGVAVLACAREIKSADTEAVASEFCTILKSYGVATAFGDRFGAEWVRGAFERHGINGEVTARPF
jgi:hypothetical protein